MCTKVPRRHFPPWDSCQKRFQPLFPWLLYSDWAGNPDDLTSISSNVIFLGSSPNSWTSRKQKTIAQSSTEAEYRAVTASAAELNWITNLMRELYQPLPSPPTIYSDNIGASLS